MAAADFLADLSKANQAASQQEKETRDLLLETVFNKADADPTYKQQLTADPEKVLQQEALKLDSKVVQVAISAVPQILPAVEEKYSTAVYGATEKKVTDLIFGTLENVEKSFKRTLFLAEGLFYVGLALTIVSLLAGLFANKDKVLVGIFGGGGIVTLISYAVMNPLDRIRGAAANLVQVQIAYLSYYKQLTMLGGANREKMVLKEAVQYADALRKSAVETIEAVQKIVEKTAPYDPRLAAGLSTALGRRDKTEEAAG